jgi:hypothetical protein
LLRHIASFLVIVGLGTSGLAECADRAISSAERMMCCSGGACPMHGSSEPGSPRAVTHAQADQCCVVSSGHHAAPSAVVFSLAAVVAGSFPTRESLAIPIVPFDAWRTHTPRPGRHVPRHVLFSVFLI